MKLSKKLILGGTIILSIGSLCSMNFQNDEKNDEKEIINLENVSPEEVLKKLEKKDKELEKKNILLSKFESDLERNKDRSFRYITFLEFILIVVIYNYMTSSCECRCP